MLLKSGVVGTTLIPELQSSSNDLLARISVGLVSVISAFLLYVYLSIRDTVDLSFCCQPWDVPTQLPPVVVRTNAECAGGGQRTQQG